MAKLLEQKKPRIALLINNLQGSYAELLWQGMVDMANDQQVEIFIFPGESIQSPGSFLSQKNIIYQFIQEQTVDLIIMATATLYAYITPDEFSDFYHSFKPIPVVSIGIAFPDLPSITANNRTGVQEAVNHLIKIHGKRRIGFIKGPDGSWEAQERYKAYHEELLKHGIQIDNSLIIQGDFTPQSGTEGALKLLAHPDGPPEAIVIANDDMALFAVRTIHSQNKRVPEDISIVGFDNVPISQMGLIPLATVKQPIYEMGLKALEIAMDILSDRPVESITLLPSLFINRDSCGCQCQKKSEERQTQVKHSQKAHLGSELIQTLNRDLMEHITLPPEKKCVIERWLDGILGLINQELINEKSFQDVELFIKHSLVEFKQIYDIIIQQDLLQLLEKEADRYFTATDLSQVLTLVGKIKNLFQEGAQRIRINWAFNFIESMDYIINSSFRNIIASTSFDELMNAIALELPGIGVRNAYICLYQKKEGLLLTNLTKLPERVQLILGYNEKGKIDLTGKETVYESTQLLPSWLELENRPHNWIIQELTLREEHFGFLMLEMGVRHAIVYDTLFLQISTALQSSLMIDQLRKAELELKINNENLNVLNKEILKHNQEMENDILMARKIQNQLIPEKSPSEAISFLYNPMEKVCGDFFDFLLFPEEKVIGIFISDVSGHGVAAAFITSMIKSAISQNRGEQDNPANLLLSLNKSLFNQTGGNFVTAFYGIYRFENHKFIYANAGHNIPYIIQEDKINMLEAHNRSLPLGVMDNQEMLINNKSYTNHTVQLAPKSKLILYTDGLTEAVPVQGEPIAFETVLLEQAFLNNSSKPAKEFIHEVYRLLVDFHGSDKFNDDVCLICLDVI